MFTCPNDACLTQFTTPGNFCTVCGAPMFEQPTQEVIPPGAGYTSASSGVPNADHAMAHGLGNIFGLHPAVAFFTMGVNLMLFGKDGLALALALPTGGGDLAPALLISVGVGALVGYVTYLGQMKWYTEDHESAKIKALITGVLTAIPTGLPGMLFGSAALAGMLLRKKSGGGAA
jgi:hypothetical protein